MVYLKLQPHIRSLVAFCSNHKLSFRYFGPFKIIAKVGSVAYKLDLPPSSAVPPVVHVFLLKKHVPPYTQVLHTLHSVATDPWTQLYPLQVLPSRVIRCGPTASLASWVDEQDMRQDYPTVWGHAAAEAGSNVKRLLLTSTASGIC